MRRVSRGALVLTLAGLGAVTPATARAQVQRPDTAIDEAQLTAYAKAFAAITEARDSAYSQLVLPRNKTEANQRELREKLQGQIDQIMRAHGLTAERYARITYVVSTSANHRKAFEEILARVGAKPGGSLGPP